ncbi:hypothetical protein M6B38_235670 [Iris pallida]|uniref:Uncharacterized protein n=1 Tax=Iris pallida TaxID=29817 RepID=A0AAX6DP30_IRIPA|nr:hypothetical protein M6B38_235670 [Iris pallida]
MMILVQPNSCGNSGFRFRSVLFLVSEFSDSFEISFNRFFSSSGKYCCGFSVGFFDDFGISVSFSGFRKFAG